MALIVAGNKSLRAGFVIATKDRPKDIRNLLKNLANLSVHPNQLIIVDSSEKSGRAVVSEFNKLNIKYIHYRGEPSASAQRNAGIKAVDSAIDLIGFLDDDCILEYASLEKMMKFWEAAPADIGGCAFNLRNPAPAGNRKIRCNSITRWLGIYSDIPGVVTRSGWGTITGTVDKDLEVKWVPSTAVVWRKQIFNTEYFEEFFKGYSYLEDLDFSYNVSKSYRIMILADAGYYHHHSVSGRTSRLNFGIVEVINRIFFVKKHNLSLSRCYCALIIRLALTLINSLKTFDKHELERFLGNIAGFLHLVGLNRKFK